MNYDVVIIGSGPAGISTAEKLISSNLKVLIIDSGNDVEIKNYGHEEQKKKLIAGIVLTGGGSQLKHLKQLVEYITGMDTRVGYPNEHLAGDSDSDITSPMYSTAVGLVMDSLIRQEKTMKEMPENNDSEAEEEITQTPDSNRNKDRGFLDKLTERVKHFLDNAE